jgi:enoyl-CoA hydratase/carnithine racemase
VTYETIIFEPGPVARVIMNRPEYRNAQSRLMIEELDDAFRSAELDDETRVVVFSGRGPCFSAGHDIGSPPEMADRERRGYANNRGERYSRSEELFLNATLRWRNLRKPTIAMVHGYCIYGGYMFASAMDLVFASDDALFLPSQLQYFSAPWDFGVKKAKEVLFENRFLTAEEAKGLGFVNRVHPRDDLERETIAYAERVAENSVLGLRLLKFSINQAADIQGYAAAVTGAFHTYVTSASGFGEQQTGSRRTAEGRRRMPGVDAAFKKTKFKEA